MKYLYLNKKEVFRHISLWEKTKRRQSVLSSDLTWRGVLTPSRFIRSNNTIFTDSDSHTQRGRKNRSRHRERERERLRETHRLKPKRTSTASHAHKKFLINLPFKSNNNKRRSWKEFQGDQLHTKPWAQRLAKAPLSLILYFLPVCQSRFQKL